MNFEKEKFAILTFSILLVHFSQNVFCEYGKPKFIGQDDAYFCQSQYGDEAKVAMNVSEPNSCYIYCSSFGKVYQTERSKLSVCGYRKYCVEKTCAEHHRNKIFNEACQPDYQYGLAYNLQPLYSCYVKCYDKNYVYKANAHKKTGTYCRTTDLKLGRCTSYTCNAIVEENGLPR